jgi:hypothetical protein
LQSPVPQVGRRGEGHPQRQALSDSTLNLILWLWGLRLLLTSPVGYKNQRVSAQEGRLGKREDTRRLSSNSNFIQLKKKEAFMDSLSLYEISCFAAGFAGNDLHPSHSLVPSTQWFQ